MKAILDIISSLNCMLACMVYAAGELESGDAAALAARVKWLRNIVAEHDMWQVRMTDILKELEAGAKAAADREQTAFERAQAEAEAESIAAAEQEEYPF